MRALLDDAARVEHNEAVHRGDGGEAVRDGDHGLAFHQFKEVFLDRGFDFGVKRGGRLVEDQDRRVLQEDARDGDALALAAGEFHAALADMRLEAAAALGVFKRFDEIAGGGLADRGADFVIGGAGAAIGDVLADGAVKQGRVLRHHTDLCPEGFLRDLGDVLTVHEDAAAFGVVEAQQQVGQRRLARAGAPNEADLLAGADGERQAFDDARALAIVEGDVLEADVALDARQGRSARRIDHGHRLVEHRHAVIDDADILEQARDFPHDPLRHRLHAQRKADRDGHGARADDVAGPEQDARGGDQEHEQRVVEIDDDVEAGDEAHLAVHGVEEAGHRIPRIGLLAAGMGEQLHGLDVRVRINDPAGHHRAGIGLLLGDLPEARHEIPEEARIDRQPEDQRRGEAPVGRADQCEGREEIDEHEDEDIEDLHHHFAHRQRRLHHLGGNTPRELVAEEAHRLAEHLPVHAPARAHRHVAHQALIDDQRLRQRRQRQADQQDAGHQREAPAFPLEEALAFSGRQPVDNPAKESEQRHLANGDQRRETGHRDQPGRRILDVVPHKGAKAPRRHAGTGLRKRIYTGFKKAEHGAAHVARGMRKSKVQAVSAPCLLPWRVGFRTPFPSRC